MKIPSDEEIRRKFERAAELRGQVNYKDLDYIVTWLDATSDSILWGLSNLARAMRAEFNALGHHVWATREDGAVFCDCNEAHSWTDAQWLQAAAEKIGVKLEEK